jgi:hypothetical protein
MIRAKGRAGSWYAVPEGETEELPCVHKKWYNLERGKLPFYLDPGVRLGEKVVDNIFVGEAALRFDFLQRTKG